MMNDRKDEGFTAHFDHSIGQVVADSGGKRRVYDSAPSDPRQQQQVKNFYDTHPGIPRPVNDQFRECDLGDVMPKVIDAEDCLSAAAATQACEAAAAASNADVGEFDPESLVPPDGDKPPLSLLECLQGYAKTHDGLEVFHVRGFTEIAWANMLNVPVAVALNVGTDFDPSREKDVLGVVRPFRRPTAAPALVAGVARGTAFVNGDWYIIVQVPFSRQFGNKGSVYLNRTYFDPANCESYVVTVRPPEAGEARDRMGKKTEKLAKQSRADQAAAMAEVRPPDYEARQAVEENAPKFPHRETEDEAGNRYKNTLTGHMPDAEHHPGTEPEPTGEEAAEPQAGEETTQPQADEAHPHRRGRRHGK